MRKKQTRTGNIATSKKASSGKRNMTKGPENKLSKRNTAGRANSDSKSGNEEMWEYVSEEIVSKCEDLKSVCMQMQKLEKEKQRLLYIILKDVPGRKKMRG